MVKGSVMASRMTEFHALRLSRAAEMAGQAFAFDDVASTPAGPSHLSNWLWWAAGIAAFAGLVSLGLA